MRKLWCRMFGHGTLNQKVWAGGRYRYLPKKARQRYGVRYNVYEGFICARCGAVIEKTKIRTGLTEPAAQMFVNNYYGEND